MNEKMRVINLVIKKEQFVTLDFEDVINEVSTNLYQHYEVKEKENFRKLPILIQDIILLIDFDTELHINGILGFLENSTGLFLDETIAMFHRINDKEDAETLEKIREIMKNYGLTTFILRENVNCLEEYQLTSCSQIHEEMFEKIVNIADNHLYLYTHSVKPFDLLEHYFNEHRKTLLQELEE